MVEQDIGFEKNEQYFKLFCLLLYGANDIRTLTEKTKLIKKPEPKNASLGVQAAELKAARLKAEHYLGEMLGVLIKHHLVGAIPACGFDKAKKEKKISKLKKLYFVNDWGLYKRFYDANKSSYANLTIEQQKKTIAEMEQQGFDLIKSGAFEKDAKNFLEQCITFAFFGLIPNKIKTFDGLIAYFSVSMFLEHNKDGISLNPQMPPVPLKFSPTTQKVIGYLAKS